MTDDPIAPAYKEFMNVLAQFLDEQFNPGVLAGGERKVAFVLLMAEIGKMEGGRVNYISNSDRPDMVELLREFLARQKKTPPFR